MEIIDSFEQLKTWLAAPKGIQSLLHVHTGLALYFLFVALIPRRNPPSLPLALAPLMLVATIQFSNELADYLTKPRYRWTDGALDSFNTLFWPSLLTIVFWRQRRALMRDWQRPGVKPRAGDTGKTHRRTPAGFAKDSQGTWRDLPVTKSLRNNIE
jgi:hypothetical protein